jgi:hypothetical protein
MRDWVSDEDFEFAPKVLYLTAQGKRSAALGMRSLALGFET